LGICEGGLQILSILAQMFIAAFANTLLAAAAVD